MKTLTNFWGEWSVPHGSSATWAVGPLRLHIERREGEWRVGRQTGPSRDGVGHLSCERPPDLLSFEDVTRFAMSHSGQKIRLQPALADRAMVARPEKPFLVAPGEIANIFVSLPLWIRVFDVQTSTMLTEFPVSRPSDTWFGTPTDGELCYATRSYGRLKLVDVPRRADRATTEVSIVNLSDRVLPLNGFIVPAPNLSLVEGPSHDAWTEDLRLERQQGDALSHVSFRRRDWAGKHVGKTLSEPRVANRNPAFRAFAAFFK